MSSEDPYERVNLDNSELKYVFVPISIPEIMDQSANIGDYRIVTHESNVDQLNKTIREKLFTMPSDFEIGDMLLDNGVLRKVKSIDPLNKQFSTQDPDSKKVISFSGQTITFEDGKKINVFTDSSESSIDKAMSLLSLTDLMDINANSYPVPGTKSEMKNSLKYGYAMSVDDLPKDSKNVIIDESSFYENELNTDARNKQQLNVFSKIKDATISSNRMLAKEVLPDPEEVRKERETTQVLTSLYERIVKPNGVLEPLNLTPEYTAESRKYAVNGLLSILDNGAVGVTREQILNTPGLPAPLAAERYFYHEGNMYINMDMVGNNSVYTELTGLFLHNLKENNASLFSRIATMVKQTPEYAAFNNMKPTEGETVNEDELVIKTFQNLLDNGSDSEKIDGFTGTMNEFINSINSSLEKIDPLLNWKTVLPQLALGINDAVRAGNVNFTKLMARPDVDAAELATGKGGITSQMNNILIDLMNTGNLIKTCK
jgi:hypothetical protein